MASQVLIFSDDLAPVEHSLIYFFMKHNKFEHVGKFTKKKYNDLHNFFIL